LVLLLALLALSSPQHPRPDKRIGFIEKDTPLCQWAENGV
jgi:hypothetical protein